MVTEGKLTGKSAIVTAGGHGIGFGISLALAAEGAAVMIAGRSADKLSRAVSEIEGRGGRACAVSCDVTIPADVQNAVDATVDTFGSLDVLVNNAQARKHAPLLEMGEESWYLAFETGLMGTYRFMVASYEHLKRSNGVIVNLISSAGMLGIRHQTAYGATKEGIRVLTRTAAVEWGPHIRAVAIAPIAASERWLDGFAKEDPELVQKIIEEVPLGRLGDPETDIGRVVAFLAGPDASYITGTSLMVDGGWAFHH